MKDIKCTYIVLFFYLRQTKSYKRNPLGIPKDLISKRSLQATDDGRLEKHKWGKGLACT